MKFQGLQESLYIEWSDYATVIADAQRKKNFKLKPVKHSKNDLVQTFHAQNSIENGKQSDTSIQDIHKIELPPLSPEYVWGLAIDQSPLPQNERVDGKQFQANVMLAIMNRKHRTHAKIRIIRDSELSDETDIKSIVKRIQDRANSISLSYAQATVNWDVHVSSAIVTRNTGQYIQTVVNAEMDKDRVAQALAEMFMIFKDRHRQQLEESMLHEDQESNLFTHFLNLLEVTQTEMIDGVAYDRNFPLLAAVKIAIDKNIDHVANDLVEEYLRNFVDRKSQVLIRVYSTSEQKTQHSFNYANSKYYPNAQSIPAEKIQKIRSLKDFDSALAFLDAAEAAAQQSKVEATASAQLDSESVENK